MDLSDDAELMQHDGKKLCFEDIAKAVESGAPEQLLEVIRRHFEQSADLINQAPCEPLHYAIDNNMIDMVTFLIGLGVVDLQKESLKFKANPLCLAARSNNLPVVELLIDAKVTQKHLSNPDSALYVAIQCGYDAIAKILFVHHQDLDPVLSDEADEWRVYAISVAVEFGRDKLVEYLWTDKIDANLPIPKVPATSFLLSTAFFSVENCQSSELLEKQWNIVQFLISKGALLSKFVAETYPMKTLQYLTHKNSNKQNATFPQIIKWVDKRICWLNYVSWFSPYQQRIVELDLSLNPFAELPPEIPWLLFNLERLTINHCDNLASLTVPHQHPQSGFCDRLTTVEITFNKQLRQIPSVWFDFTNLTSANFAYNFLDKIAVTKDSHKEWTCSRLETLNLHGNRLKEIPPQISGAKHLKYLDVGSNQLEKLPAPWKCSLLELDVSHNKLTTLPDNMKGYWGRSLEALDASHNRLSSVPVDLCLLLRLTSLELSNNLLQHLPPAELWCCRKLKHLDLSFNQLGPPTSKMSNITQWFQNKRSATTVSKQETAAGVNAGAYENRGGTLVESKATMIPSYFLDDLRSLNLSRNNLLSVPSELCQLKQLTELDVSHNPHIHNLPIQLGKLKNLEVIRLDGLDLKQMPNQLNPRKSSDEGRKVKTEEILRHLRSKLRREEAYRCMKVVVLGKQSCGKTSFLRNLWDIKTISSTKCLTSSVAQLYPKDKNKKAVRFNVWELSGPESYYPIHQCFMTDNAIYLLIFRLDELHLFDINSWLITIKHVWYDR